MIVTEKSDFKILLTNRKGNYLSIDMQHAYVRFAKKRGFKFTFGKRSVTKFRS